MIEKKSAPLKRETLFWVWGLIITLTLITGIPHFMKVQKLYKHLISLNPREITLQLNNHQRELTDMEKVTFIEQLQNKNIARHHSHPLEDFSVSIELTMAQGEKYLFAICPDSDIVGEYWIRKDGSDLRQVQSLWLRNLFKESQFFDHQDIVDKKNQRK